MTLEELQQKHKQQWKEYFKEHNAAMERMLITKSLSIIQGEDQASKQEDALKAFDTWRAHWGVNGVLVKSIKEKQKREKDEFFEREKLLNQLNNPQASSKDKDREL